MSVYIPTGIYVQLSHDYFVFSISVTLCTAARRLEHRNLTLVLPIPLYLNPARTGLG